MGHVYCSITIYPFTTAVGPIYTFPFKCGHLLWKRQLTCPDHLRRHDPGSNLRLPLGNPSFSIPWKEESWIASPISSQITNSQPKTGILIQAWWATSCIPEPAGCWAQFCVFLWCLFYPVALWPHSQIVASWHAPWQKPVGVEPLLSCMVYLVLDRHSGCCGS